MPKTRLRKITTKEELKPSDKPVAICTSIRCVASEDPSAYRVKHKVVDGNFCPDCLHAVLWLPRKDRYPRRETADL